MTQHSPIAYTYEADYHCPDCTTKRFGEECEGTDNEGNSVGAVFSWDEWWQLDEEREHLVCGDCGNVLAIHGPADGYAKSVGFELGKAAATWVEIDSPEQAAEILRQLAECDFEYPAPLSGEWADGLSPRDVLRDLGASEDDEDASFLLDEWEQGYSEGFEEELVRACKYQLAD